MLNDMLHAGSSYLSQLHVKHKSWQGGLLFCGKEKINSCKIKTAEW
jgi:hypothetical protein